MKCSKCKRKRRNPVSKLKLKLINRVLNAVSKVENGVKRIRKDYQIIIN